MGCFYRKLPAKLSTTIDKIKLLENPDNIVIINQFLEFMKENGASERHQNNNLKAIIAYSQFLDKICLKNIHKKEEILSFLQTKIKNKEDDPDQRWITTYNDYLHRIKHFFRWLHNEYLNSENLSMDLWKTPDFLILLKPKKTKRLSPYSESEIWTKEELLSIIKYEPYKRNKAILALLWDLDARPHEITNLKIKHIRLKEKYGEGEIPFESKTGTGPILLTMSFPYVRDWLNEHPFKNEPNARLIGNLHNGAPIKPEALHTMMLQLKYRIQRLLDSNEIMDPKERDNLHFLLNTKKWNPYCIRHSSITSDSDYLPEYALKKKVRWSMNSRQGSRYIKTRLGNELRNRILEQNGIITDDYISKKTLIVSCPRCTLTNVFENKYCSECSYPLTPEAFDEIKQEEEKRFRLLEENNNIKFKNLENKMNDQILNIIKIIKQNPLLANVKPDILKTIGQS